MHLVYFRVKLKPIIVISISLADGGRESVPLQRQGLGAKKAAKKPALNKRLICQRLEWCEEHKDKMEDDWIKVLFSDASKFV